MFKKVQRITGIVLRVLLFLYMVFGLTIFSTAVYNTSRTLGVLSMFLLAFATTDYLRSFIEIRGNEDV